MNTMCMSGSGLRFFANHACRKVATRKHRQNTVADSVGQNLRPLVHGLVRDTYGLCRCRDGPAEKFDGFCLEHAVLNHSSDSSATMVHGGAISLVNVEYKDRFAEAMKLAGVAEHQVAAALGISYQAVKKVLAGTTSALTASNNSVAATYMKVDADWLATGLGTARSERVWPFKSLTVEQWHSVSQEVRDAAERMLVASAKPVESEQAHALILPDKRQIKHPAIDIGGTGHKGMRRISGSYVAPKAKKGSR